MVDDSQHILSSPLPLTDAPYIVKKIDSLNTVLAHATPIYYYLVPPL